MSPLRHAEELEANYDRSRSRQDWSCHVVGESRPRSRSRSRESAIAVNAYLADVYIYTDPTTTTPPTRREHHRSRSSLSSPLVSFL
jgi:hypothetical protein